MYIFGTKCIFCNHNSNIYVIFIAKVAIYLLPEKSIFMKFYALL